MAFRPPPPIENDYEKELCPAGMHPAICVGVVDIGLQPTEWKGIKKDKPQIVLLWEFPTLTREWEKDNETFIAPFMLSKKLNYSFDDRSNLTKILGTWRGTPMSKAEREVFDVSKLLDQPCTINVMHGNRKDTGAEYAFVESVYKIMPDHANMPPRSNALNLYSMPQDQTVIPDTVPNWIKELIINSPEFQVYLDKQQPRPSVQAASPNTAPVVTGAVVGETYQQNVQQAATNAPQPTSNGTAPPPFDEGDELNYGQAEDTMEDILF